MSCPICSSTSRGAIDAALASDSHASPRRISQLFPRFSRAQVRRHRDVCLLGFPRVVHAMRRGDLSGEDLAGLLRERGLAEEEIEFTLAAVGRLLEGPEAGQGGGGR